MTPPNVPTGPADTGLQMPRLNPKEVKQEVHGSQNDCEACVSTRHPLHTSTRMSMTLTRCWPLWKGHMTLYTGRGTCLSTSASLGNLLHQVVNVSRSTYTMKYTHQMHTSHMRHLSAMTRLILSHKLEFKYLELKRRDWWLVLGCLI